MINIKQKEACVGCGACVQRCPKGCIALREDAEGFLYPEADASRCIDCGLCEKVCPVIHRGEARDPLMACAAVNGDEAVRRSSSSGGVFTALALETIQRGGVVFGARFDEHWEVVHGWTERAEGLGAFRGSKYVQSRIGGSYGEVESFLRSGREVLFSGTPCQVAGLRRYLRKDYVGLTTLDFICHGVPSPGVWREYLQEEIARQCDRKNTVSPVPISERDALIEGISFRNKAEGWKKFSFSLSLSLPAGQGTKNSVFLCELLTENAYLRGFLADLYLRPSCHACPAKGLRSGSDVTVADYWGVGVVHPELDDDGGVSVVLVNTAVGQEMVGGLKNVRLTPTRYADVVRFNPAVERSARVPAGRGRFWELREELGVIGAVGALVKDPPMWRRAAGRAKRAIKAALVTTGLLPYVKRIIKKQ